MGTAFLRRLRFPVLVFQSPSSLNCIIPIIYSLVTTAKRKYSIVWLLDSLRLARKDVHGR